MRKKKHIHDLKTIIKLSNISKVDKKSNSVIIANLNLSIYAGEILGLLGSSGCGKSTIINIMAGIDHQYSGEIYIRGVDSKHVDIYHRNLRILNTETELFDYLNIYENIKIGFREEYSQKEVEKEIIKISNKLNMQSMLHKYPHDLSYGQKQKAKFARIIVDYPEIVLLDEPFDGLDEANSEIVYNLIRYMNKNYNTTFIISSHDNYEILEISTRLTIMKQGKIVLDDSKDNILCNHNSYSCEYFDTGTAVFMKLIEQNKDLFKFMISRKNIIDVKKNHTMLHLTGTYFKGYIDPRSEIKQDGQKAYKLIKIIDFIFYYQNIFEVEHLLIQINTIKKLQINQFYDIELKFLFIKPIKE